MMTSCEAMQTDYHRRMQVIELRKESLVDSIKVQLRKLFTGLGWEDDFGRFTGIGQSAVNLLMCP
jgi:hypothetical protein